MRVLHYRLPVRRSEAEPDDRQSVEVLALRGSRRSRTGTGVHQGVSDELPEFRYTRRLASKGGGSCRRAEVRWFCNSRCVQPSGGGRYPRAVCAGSSRRPGDVWTAEGSEDPVERVVVEGPAQVDREHAADRRNSRHAGALFEVWSAGGRGMIDLKVEK